VKIGEVVIPSRWNFLLCGATEVITSSRMVRFAVRVTHKPTGISAMRDSNHFRTQRAAYDSAIKYIKSRIYMLGHEPMKECELLIEPCDNT